MDEKVFETEHGAIHYWVSRAEDNGATSAVPEASLEPDKDPTHGAGAATSAPWLILLPGLTADHTTFAPQVEYFKGRVNLFSWDAPAHGASRRYPLNFSIDDMARILAAIFATEGIERPVFAGQSLGGYISQAFMDLYPGRAAGFISIDSAPLKRSYYPRWEVTLLRHTKLMYLSIPWAILRPWGARGASTSEAGRTQMLSFMDSYQKQEYCELVSYCYAKLADAIDEDRPYKIDCPALLLCGEKDAAGDVKPFNRKWTTGEGIPLVWVPDAGHLSNADNPAFVNEYIEAFLEQIS